MIDNKSKETYIKNCTYYNLDDLININDVAFVNVIIEEASLFVVTDINYHKVQNLCLFFYHKKWIQ